MARTSEATTSETSGAGSEYWTRPRSNIGARVLVGPARWSSPCGRESQAKDEQ